MAKPFKNWSDLEKHLKQQIDDTLNKEVAKVVKDEIQMAIDEKVYMSGEPLEYYRRGSRDGYYMGNPLGTGSLADQEEMKHEVKNGELIVIDEAKPSDDFDMDLAYSIEYGYGTRDKWWNKPRPFMGAAVVNMESSKSHVDAMREGLEKRLGKGTIV